MMQTERRTAGPLRPAWAISSARANHVWDRHGKRYLDLTSGWNVVNAGWNNEEIMADWQACLTELPFRPSWCSDKYREALDERLATLAPGYHFLYACTGSEGIDHALKIARLVSGQPGVACLSGAFHGSTSGSALAAGTEVGHLACLVAQKSRLALPFPVDAASLLEIEQRIRGAGDLGALVFETVLTNAGSGRVPDGFLQLVRRLSRELGFLLVCDEVGTGINRTGAMFSILERGFRPDILVSGKALTNGLYPLSVTAFLPQFMPFLDETSFGSTFGGSSAGCAAALATLNYHERHALGPRAVAGGGALRSRLERNCAGFASVKKIEGCAMELALHLNWEALSGRFPDSAALLDGLHDKGLFAVLCPPGDHIMLMPPLNTSPADLLLACDLICELVCV